VRTSGGAFSAFDLPSERFGFFALTDEKGGERLDRLSWRPYLQPDRVGALLDAGADIVVRQLGGMPVGLAPTICSLCCAKERGVD
jgi:hypothetical protein